MSKKATKNILTNLFSSFGLILLIAFLIRVLLHDTLTYSLDLNTFIAWGRRLQEVGFGKFYVEWSDYLPGYLYVLWLLAGIEKVIALSPTLLYKLPAIIADLGVGYLIYKVVSDRFNKRTGVLFSSLFLFNPAIFANSTMWGQVDILTALFALLAVYAFDKKWFISAAALAIGTIIKPQAALAAPIVLLLMLRAKWKIPKIVFYGLISLAVVLLIFIPFADGKDLLRFAIERFQITIAQYPYTSVNAFNFWGLGGFWNSDSQGTITAATTGLIVTLGSSLTVLFFGWRRKLDPYLLLSLLLTIHFMFFTRLHERHMLPIFAPMIIAAASNRKLLIPYIGFSITYLANLWYAYYWTTYNFGSPYPEFFTTFLILLNLVFLGWLLASTFLKFRINLETKQEVKEEIKFFQKYKKQVLCGILLFAAFTRLFALASPANEYFDEVYHTFTARIMVEGDPRAWEWWNTHPEGFAYEWTHPPFAKLIMATSMFVFGQSSFAWRLPAAVFGVGVIYLVYRIGREVFDSEEVGLIAAAIVSLDGLVLVMSRIGMNDIYLLFFSLLTFLFFYKQKYFWAALAFGFAISSKWSAVWLLPLLGITFLAYRRRIVPQLLFFAVLPPLVYLANYLPMFTTGHGLDIWWGMQKQMWWYHTGLDAEHAYTSRWWSWPLNLRPVWLYVNRVENTVANIYAMGNPIVLWGGLISAVMAIYELFVRRSKALALMIFGWLIFFLPWSLSPRIMFFYHYLPAIPFLALVTAYVLRQEPKLLKIFLAIGLVVFIYFYPHWTGITVPNWLAETYYWLPSWR